MSWEVIAIVVGWAVSVGTILYTVGRWQGKIEAMINALMTNHLPHIYEELKYLRSRLDDSQRSQD